MEHLNPRIIDQLFAFSRTEPLTLFLLDTLYSPMIGFFLNLPDILFLIGDTSSGYKFHELDSQLLKPYVPRISRIITNSFSHVRQHDCVFLAVEK